MKQIAPQAFRWLKASLGNFLDDIPVSGERFQILNRSIVANTSIKVHFDKTPPVIHAGRTGNSPLTLRSANHPHPHANLYGLQIHDGYAGTGSNT